MVIKGNDGVFLEFVYSDMQISPERHFHNAYELMYVCEGTIVFEINDVCYIIKPHTMLFISKFEEHSMRIIDSPYRRYYIILNPSQLDSLIDDPNMKLIFINHSDQFNHALDVSTQSVEVNMLFEAMLNEYDNPDAYSDLALNHYFRLIMILCCRIKTEQSLIPNTKIGHATIDAQKYIDLHFTEDIRVDALAERFFINASHLSHTFHKLTGNSPKQYIMRCRISYAKELLLNTNLSVAEIGVRCGFGDVSNFIRSFKKETYETPFRYRSINKP